MHSLSDNLSRRRLLSGSGRAWMSGCVSSMACGAIGAAASQAPLSAARASAPETLPIAVGEMGRTAGFNGNGGRDHWGNVFSFVLAGAGLKAGQAYGSSDRTGAWPATDRTTPPQLTATLLHLLGVSHEAMFPDPAGRPLRVVEGEPIAALL